MRARVFHTYGMLSVTGSLPSMRGDAHPNSCPYDPYQLSTARFNLVSLSLSSEEGGLPPKRVSIG